MLEVSQLVCGCEGGGWWRCHSVGVRVVGGGGVTVCRGGAGISKVVRPLHIKDDSCMCKEGGGSTTGNVQMI